MTANARFLQGRIALYGAAKAEASAAVWDHPEFPRLYPELLKLAHDTIVASAHLMETAAEAAAARPGDPVAAALVPYLRAHAGEEAGHDAWVREDLARLGVSAAELVARPPSPFAAALVGAQYFWIHHAHPVALLGYLAALEWEHPEPAWFDAVAARTGLPTEAFSCYRRHAQLDPAHRAEMEALLDALPLTEYQRSLLGLSVLHTSQALADLYAGLLGLPGIAEE